jgi:hypothetical protein
LPQPKIFWNCRAKSPGQAAKQLDNPAGRLQQAQWFSVSLFNTLSCINGLFPNSRSRTTDLFGKKKTLELA